MKIRSAFKNSVILLSLWVTSTPNAQDYPYDAADQSSRSDRLPVERPSTAERSGKGRTLPSLFRVGLKLGFNWALFQTPNGELADTVSGLGPDGYLSFGWDLPYQPIFIELESGYRGLFFSDSNERLNVIPLRFGTFHRSRIGDSDLIKFGLVPSLDLRMQSTPTDTQTSLVPGLAFAFVYESGGFLIQPEFTLFRFRKNNNFWALSNVIGWRF
jgi:hypothetical protein